MFLGSAEGANPLTAEPDETLRQKDSALVSSGKSPAGDTDGANPFPMGESLRSATEGARLSNRVPFLFNNHPTHKEGASP
jgi:hypothetical protein